MPRRIRRSSRTVMKDETGLLADLMADDDAHQDEGVDGAAKRENTNR